MITIGTSQKKLKSIKQFFLLFDMVECQKRRRMWTRLKTVYSANSVYATLTRTLTRATNPTRMERNDIGIYLSRIRIRPPWIHSHRLRVYRFGSLVNVSHWIRLAKELKHVHFLSIHFQLLSITLIKFFTTHPLMILCAFLKYLS